MTRNQWIGAGCGGAGCLGLIVVKDHVVWIFKNTDWITEYNTPEKARAYVDEHIND
jgi:hypothetical protein